MRAQVKAAAEKIIKETGASVTGVAGDVSDPSVPEKIIEQAAKFLGGLDLLVTNAADLRRARSIRSMKPPGRKPSIFRS